jgi:hypothetical protein
VFTGEGVPMSKEQSLAISIEAAAAKIENELGLPTNFLWNLRHDDDWSVIIKLHALIETAVTHLLVRYFGHDELEDVFSNMELGNVRAGKVVFLSKLNCLEESQRGFIRSLSKLRNHLVHDIRNVRFSLTEHAIDKEKAPSRAWVQENSKQVFLVTGIICLSSIYLEKELAMTKQEIIQKILAGFELK